MRIKEVTLTKKYKVGLPKYSSMDVGASVTWEIKENEDFDFNKAWDLINQNLTIQSSDTDPAWIHGEELKDDYKAVIKIPKKK